VDLLIRFRMTDVSTGARLLSSGQHTTASLIRSHAVRSPARGRAPEDGLIMGISNSNMAFGYRLTPDLASQIMATAPASHCSPVPRLPRINRLRRGRRPGVTDHN
jgi:hypothetical protein